MYKLLSEYTKLIIFYKTRMRIYSIYNDGNGQKNKMYTDTVYLQYKHLRNIYKQISSVNRIARCRERARNDRHTRKAWFTILRISVKRKETQNIVFPLDFQEHTSQAFYDCI